MLPRLRTGPVAMGATALLTAVVIVGGLITAAAVTGSAPSGQDPAVAAAALPQTPTADPVVVPSGAATPITPSTEPRSTTDAAGDDGPPLVIGDSIAVGSAEALRSALGRGTTVDAAVGRQFSAAPAAVAAWVARHDGPVVVELGANGTVSAADVEAVIDAAGPRRVVFVGTCVPRHWQAANNATITRVVARHPQAGFVDWARIVAGAPGLLGADQVHPTPHGRALLAAAVRDALER